MDDEVFILFPSRFPSQRYLRAVIFVVFLQKIKLKVLQIDKMQIIYVTMYIMWYLIACYREFKELLSRGENSYAFHIHAVPFVIRSILGSTDCRGNNSLYYLILLLNLINFIGYILNSTDGRINISMYLWLVHFFSTPLLMQMLCFVYDSDVKLFLY